MISTALIQATEYDANPFVPNIWEIATTLLAFAVLFLIIWKVVAPRFETAYQNRVEAIEGGINEAEEAKAEARELKAQYERQLQELRHESASMREEARAEAGSIVAEAREKAAAESARIREQAHAQIEADRASAAESLRSDVGSLATELASKIVGEALNDDARSQRVVDRFLTDLETEQPHGARP